MVLKQPDTLSVIRCAVGALCSKLAGSLVNVSIMSRVKRKPTFWFPTWSDTNRAVQLQKMARGLKFWIWKV